MRRAVPSELPAPLGAINITPLIDVLLVLLVMLIITIPPRVGAVKLDLPSGTVRRLKVDPRVNLLTIDAGARIRWNGASIDRKELGAELAIMRQMEPAPELHLRPAADARHGDVVDLLATIRHEQISSFIFVGNEQYRAVF